MIWDSKESELRIRLASRLIDQEISPSDFYLLSRWLDCHAYILPARRVIVQRILNCGALDIESYFKHYLACRVIESSLTYSEQCTLEQICPSTSVS